VSDYDMSALRDVLLWAGRWESPVPDFRQVDTALLIDC